MASIVLFHSALGLTTGTKKFAETLARDGHTVLTPDLFDGETFRTVEEGVRKRDALGIPELMQRAAKAAEVAPTTSIYAGFSMGAAAAQFLAVTRPGARGAVLMHAVLPLAAMGTDGGPKFRYRCTRAKKTPGSTRRCSTALLGRPLLRYSATPVVRISSLTNRAPTTNPSMQRC